MRSQQEAADEAAWFIVDTIEALQDADAPEYLIDDAEELQSEIAKEFDVQFD